ncbi:MAG: hypothetical protein JSV12_01750 [Candidatus Bathyarchaeota archaeon]|nr:MAG: hypothetical protein JSV12_01750 [Candidatus Bathyarchaeota archaeon]
MVEASRSHYEISVKLGERYKDLAESMMEDLKMRVKVTGLTWGKVVFNARKHLPRKSMCMGIQRIQALIQNDNLCALNQKSEPRGFNVILKCTLDMLCSS